MHDPRDTVFVPLRKTEDILHCYKISSKLPFLDSLLTLIC